MPSAYADIDRAAYSLICSSDGITARELARKLGVTRKEVNQCLYRYPFIHDLCYHDEDYRWHGLIRQAYPHEGLRDYCGWYGFVDEFLSLDEHTWLNELEQGCRAIGRNLNDARGLIHSFTDARQVMRGLFVDLHGCSVDCDNWELAFELRVRRAKWVRIYADVLVITPTHAFSLEFKMKDTIALDEVAQAAKYVPYLEVILGPELDVIPALVLTRASDLFSHAQVPNTSAELPVASADMLFNVFDEYLTFLGQ